MKNLHDLWYLLFHILIWGDCNFFRWAQAHENLPTETRLAATSWCLFGCKM